MEQLTTIATTTAFDAHKPPEHKLLSDCVHCGFCLPACPTYVLWGEEMDSPRGRIYMMEKAAKGQAELNQTFGTHMDNCLGCMACMTACPSGVQYNKLIEDTRGQVERNVPRSGSDRAFRSLLFVTFPHPARLWWLALPMLVYQRTGLQKLVRASGILRLLPERLAVMEALLPRVPMSMFHDLPRETKATAARLRVGMLSGCVQSVFFQHVNQATVRVLRAEGCDVVVPQAQGCCGALMMHSGLDEDASAMAKQIIMAFEQANVDVVVSNAAGCGSTMKDYAHLLRDDAEWAGRAAAFSSKCRDVSEILAGLPVTAERHPLPLRVAYHDACHLRHAQGVYEEPRSLLDSIPGLELAEMEEPNLCCGSAGVYNLLQPEPAMELGDRKVRHLLATGAQAVISANPGCLLQLMAGLRRAGHAELPAFHMVELLDASIRGESVETLLRSRNRV